MWKKIYNWLFKGQRIILRHLINYTCDDSEETIVVYLNTLDDIVEITEQIYAEYYLINN